LPKLGVFGTGIEIARPRLLALFNRRGAAPVRMLCAPHGAGKSTALRDFAAGRADVHLVTLPPRASSAQVRSALTRRPDATLTIVDQADGASAAGVTDLFEHIEATLPGGKRYLLSGCSRTRLRVHALLARGVASMVDASLLPFNSEEIAALAAAQGVVAEELDVEQLRYDTDGWPVAVAWIVRDAAREGRALRGAFEHWRQRNGHLLLELVTAAHGDDDHAQAFVSAVWSLAEPASQRTLERLDAEGFPIVRMRASVRPYRVLMQIANDAPSAERAPPADRRLMLTLFGRFSCTIADHPVVFDRRRDQNVLTFIALSPGATVTRTMLHETFWPDAPPAVASQGLRTTLCRLRRALALAAGSNADRYVRVGKSVALDLDWVSVDARTFRACLDLAAAEAAVGNRHAAREHYLQAERLYTGTLLASEALEATLAPSAAEYGELFEQLLAQLTEMQAPQRV
jgi:hypothetical protein